MNEFSIWKSVPVDELLSTREHEIISLKSLLQEQAVIGSELEDVPCGGEI